MARRAKCLKLGSKPGCDFTPAGYSITQPPGGASGVMVIVAEYGHGDTSSNPGPD